MTLSDAIARTDALRPNSFTRRQKLDWLSALDGAVTAELINTHEGGEWVKFEAYTEESAPDTRLLVPPPYEEVYLRYLEAQMDYANGEFDRFTEKYLSQEKEAFDEYGFKWFFDFE